MILANQWQDYELLDAGYGEKLERWGNFVLQRPDPQAVWPHGKWDRPDAVYHRSDRGGGSWEFLSRLPQTWPVAYPGMAGEMRFDINLTAFKHTGLFPEQGPNWDWTAGLIQERRAAGGEARILNLFAYTGAATVAAAMAGATEVVHVDAAKGMVGKAKENLELNGLGKSYVRTIVDDVNKFVAREVRRGRRYDGIIMDPPAYGRGPNGELWQIEDSIYELVSSCAELLTDDPLFFLINSYASSLTPSSLASILELTVRSRHGGHTETSELGLPMTRQPLVLPAGFTARWSQSQS